MKSKIDRCLSKLGGNLRIAREAAGISQVELAKKSKLSRASISALEAGKGDPSLSTLIRLATALEISISMLLLDEAAWQRLLIFLDTIKLTNFSAISKSIDPNTKIEQFIATLLWGQLSVSKQPDSVAKITPSASFGSKMLDEAPLIGGLFCTLMSNQENE